MKKFHKTSARNALIPLALAYPVFARAAALSFDCDVPADHYSSVSQDSNGPMTISGTIMPVKMRQGSYLPVAGARLISSDQKSSTAFQLVADPANDPKLNIVLKTNRGDDSTSNVVGLIGKDEAISFNLTVSDQGKVTLQIGGSSFNADFIPMSSGKEMAFCSTGQFKFSDLMFAAADKSTISAP